VLAILVFEKINFVVVAVAVAFVVFVTIVVAFVVVHSALRRGTKRVCGKLF